MWYVRRQFALVPAVAVRVRLFAALFRVRAGRAQNCQHWYMRTVLSLALTLVPCSQNAGLLLFAAHESEFEWPG